MRQQALQTTVDTKRMKFATIYDPHASVFITYLRRHHYHQDLEKQIKEDIQLWHEKAVAVLMKTCCLSVPYRRMAIAEATQITPNLADFWLVIRSLHGKSYSSGKVAPNFWRFHLIFNSPKIPHSFMQQRV